MFVGEMDSVGHRLNWILEQISASGVGGDFFFFETKQNPKVMSKVGGGMQSPRRGPQG